MKLSSDWNLFNYNNNQLWKYFLPAFVCLLDHYFYYATEWNGQGQRTYAPRHQYLKIEKKNKINKPSNFWDKKSQLDIPEPLSELLSFLDVLFVNESFRLSGIFEDFNELFGKTTLNKILLWLLCFYYERIPPLDFTRFFFLFSLFFFRTWKNK